MEALLFRGLVGEIGPMLLGRRLERIYSPHPGWWSFRLQPGDHPRFLLFAHHPADVALTLSPHAPENPPAPTAQVMRLRKHVQGLRILCCKADWTLRRLSLGLGRHDPHTWLVLDAQKGVFMADQPEPRDIDASTTSATDLNDSEAISWPTWEQIRDNDQIWQSHPHVSPLLRRTIQTLPEDQGRSLLQALQSGIAPETYFLYRAPGGGKSSSTIRPWALPWPLPPSLRQGRDEHPCASAFQATNLLAQTIFFPDQASNGTAAPDPREIKRIARLRRNLDADEHRLREYVRLADQAELIRCHLYQLPAKQLAPRSKIDRLTLNDPKGETVELTLNKRLTILENMQRWFQLADKGRRGLAHVQRRRDQIHSNPDTNWVETMGTRTTASSNHRPPVQKARNRPNDKGTLPLHRFLSSDGFVLLRGKNQKANHHLLTKAASPFDYWFHAADGPGAHLILKRDSPGRDVPERTMEEAAGLAGLASHFSGAARATIICAQVKYVRPVKGTPGMAVVDQVLRTLSVPLEPDLETKLRITA
ncbi:NFACT RNA binding domain-containing protein [Desulfonatronum thiodismutans]|uniref:NFACT RNA binding domain-containing protein n=1 Tax=Desulfonatronum thiodismutans TaxID=159290 RepID=UPI0004ABD782|nr:NFACT RNA binding domain-containing protein [Desulfonatronum thiodismutans]